MAHHIVKAGECMASIADRHGHFQDTIWMAPENASLKNRRKDQNVLLEGDRVFIPDLCKKEDSRAVDKRHRFRRKGVPSELSIQLLDVDRQPIANEDYRLTVDGTILTGMTDGQGWVRQTIPPDASDGLLQLDRGEEYPLQLGYLDPLDSTTGLQQRLANLGYPCGDDGAEELGPGTFAAVRLFRADHEMSIPDELDDATLSETRDKLKAEHYT